MKWLYYSFFDGFLLELSQKDNYEHRLRTPVLTLHRETLKRYEDDEREKHEKRESLFFC